MRTGADGLGRHWGWIVALGVALLVMGFLALSNLFFATVVSVLYVGVLMLIGGIGQIVMAFRLRKSGGFFLWFMSGLLYAAVGALAIYNPLLAAQALTFLLAVLLVAAGLARIGVGWSARRAGKGWGWVVAAGVLGIIVGAVVLLGWPLNSLLMLGVILAVDLTFLGVSAVAFGLAVRARR